MFEYRKMGVNPGRESGDSKRLADRGVRWRPKQHMQGSLLQHHNDIIVSYFVCTIVIALHHKLTVRCISRTPEFLHVGVHDSRRHGCALHRHAFGMLIHQIGDVFHSSPDFHRRLR